VIVRELGERLRLPALKAEIPLEEVFARVAFLGAMAGSGTADAS
jgi:hypothetical protein